MIISKCVICGSRKSKFIKKQDAKGLLSNLGIKTPLSKIPVLGDILFWMHIIMNEIVITFLLVGDKFMPEMHLRQPARSTLDAGFTYSAFWPFTKNRERIKKFKETGDTSYIYKNELDKACFQHDMAFGDFKDLKKKNHSR